MNFTEQHFKFIYIAYSTPPFNKTKRKLAHKAISKFQYY